MNNIGDTQALKVQQLTNTLLCKTLTIPQQHLKTFLWVGFSTPQPTHPPTSLSSPLLCCYKNNVQLKNCQKFWIQAISYIYLKGQLYTTYKATYNYLFCVLLNKCMSVPGRDQVCVIECIYEILLVMFVGFAQTFTYFKICYLEISMYIRS